jgi:predicted membrane protein
MATRNFKLSFQLVLGLFIIALGVLYTLENLGLVYAHDILRFWPILIAFYGISKIIQSQTMGQKAWGVFWTIVGSFWFLDRLDVLYFNIWDLWPLILVGIGASLIWRPARRGSSFTGMGTIGDSSSTINAFSLMGSFKRANDSQDFRGGEATAIMGGCELDLRKASIQEGDAVLYLVAIMGGVEIWVPENWVVVMQGVPVLGGFEDKTHPVTSETNKRLVIKGYSIMGGVEIKN